VGLSHKGPEDLSANVRRLTKPSVGTPDRIGLLANGLDEAKEMGGPASKTADRALKCRDTGWAAQQS